MKEVKYGYRPDEAAHVIGSPSLFRDMVEAKWIEPVVQRNKLTLFDGGHIAKCWARILAGETPPMRKR